MKYKTFSKTISSSLLLSFLSCMNSFAEENKSWGQTYAVPFDTCKPEDKVSFKGNETTKLSSKEIRKLLVGNTLLSVDRYGTFAIFYPENGKTVEWMPKEKNTNYDWSAGNVSFSNDKYCRTWKEWRSGKSVNCWEIHKGKAKHYDTNGFYFLCENGVPDGDVHVILKGNAFGVSYSGNGAKSGKLKQNDEIAAQKYQKYFGKYINK